MMYIFPIKTFDQQNLLNDNLKDLIGVVIILYTYKYDCIICIHIQYFLLSRSHTLYALFVDLNSINSTSIRHKMQNDHGLVT